MHLLLIRHAESVDNVASLYAGTRDSPLTAHGALQASRLASSLAPHLPAHIFSSDLQRAVQTARATGEAVQLRVLREKFFGSGEGLPFGSAYVGAESAASMVARADTFLDEYLFPILASGEETVMVVSHGLILGTLFKRLCARIPPSEVPANIPWSNTGYLSATLTPSTLHILRVNCLDHLTGLRKTRGGIGSARFDPSQKTLSSFFKPADAK